MKKTKLLLLSMCIMLSAVFVGVGVDNAYALQNENCAQHNFMQVTIEPTCTTEGYTTHFCLSCGFCYTSNHTNALGHQIESGVINPTCVDEGYTLYACKVCDYSHKDNYVNALGHDYSEYIVLPTCVAYGYTEHICEHSYTSDFIINGEHDYNFNDTPHQNENPDTNEKPTNQNNPSLLKEILLTILILLLAGGITTLFIYKRKIKNKTK